LWSAAVGDEKGTAISRSSVRAERSAARREAILAAALDEFALRGFAATRLDDVARRAGIAKGTIYLYFRDKEMLFTELIRSSLGPIIAGVEAAPRELPLRVFAERFVETFVTEIYGTRRRDVLRLVITEGARFPQLAEIYYRVVIKRALAAVRGMVQRAIDRGEVHGDALKRFPQLLVAPGLVAVVWQALFARFEPLDVAAMMRAHIDLLFAALERRAP
jgi:AcrR family transcriptional regulator